MKNPFGSKRTTDWVYVATVGTLAKYKEMKKEWDRIGVKSKAVKTINGYAVYDKPIIMTRW